MEVKTFLSTFSEGKEFTEYVAEFYKREIPSPEYLETLNYQVSSYIVGSRDSYVYYYILIII